VQEQQVNVNSRGAGKGFSFITPPERKSTIHISLISLHQIPMGPEETLHHMRCLDRYCIFNKSKYLSLTIIPWTIEWLYFYKIWLATGEWCGGGEHPANNKPKI